ncbi:MAG: hypothetical protein GKR89_13365 [Candidatus Latescibacteria bacterium]|nr:hypothetical protein [Candidatus Latescibacterota bacterium]
MKTHPSDQLLPVRIFGIYPYVDPQDVQQICEACLVVLKGDEERVLPITIGRFEGRALDNARRQRPLHSRPLPHNLLQELVERVEGKVEKLIIHTLEDDVFHANIFVRTAEQTFYLDCRPSDGLILATIASAPVYVSQGVMDQAGREIDGLSEKEAAEEEIKVVVTRSRSQEEAPAVAGQDEPEGGEIRQEQSELERLKSKLDRLVAEEAYEEAAQIRDRISQIESD